MQTCPKPTEPTAPLTYDELGELLCELESERWRDQLHRLATRDPETGANFERLRQFAEAAAGGTDEAPMLGWWWSRRREILEELETGSEPELSATDVASCEAALRVLAVLVEEGAVGRPTATRHAMLTLAKLDTSLGVDHLPLAIERFVEALAVEGV